MALTIYLLRMGIIALLIWSVAVATNVYTAEEYGTAFIQSATPATFYQDSYRASINVEIVSPRILLDYQEYSECDASFQIDGIPLCHHMFNEFDTRLGNLLDLNFINKEQHKHITTSPHASDISVKAKRKELHDVQKALADELAAVYQKELTGKKANRNRREVNNTSTTSSSITSAISDEAKWVVLVEHTLSQFHKLGQTLCEVYSEEVYKKPLEDKAMEKVSLKCAENPSYNSKIILLALIQKVLFGHFYSVNPIPDGTAKDIPIPTIAEQQDLIQYIHDEFAALSEFARTSADDMANNYNGFTEFFIPSRKQLRLKHVEQLRNVSDIAQANAAVLEKRLSANGHQRSKRGAGLVAAGVTALSVGSAVLGYFIGESETQLAMDEFRQGIQKNKDAILGLNSAVQLNERNLAEIADILKKEPKLVLTGRKTLPFEILFESSQVKAGLLNTRFDVTNALHISKLNSMEYVKLENYILTLKNSRLPLDKNFLLAVRAQCLSLQTQTTIYEAEYCNEISFYSTRWDTNLKFEGLGVVYIDEEQTMVKSIVYSVSLDIPILYQVQLEQLQIINLGRFATTEVIKRIKLPDNAIISKSKVIHPFNQKHCIKLLSSIVCPTHSIGTFDSCLAGVFNGTLPADCNVEKVASQTACIGTIQDEYAVVSLSKPGRVHYNTRGNRHMHATEMIGTFGLVNRTTEHGNIYCEKNSHQHIPPELQIPAKKTTISSHIVISPVKTTGSVLKVSSSDDKLQMMAGQLHEQEQKLDDSANELHANIHNTNSTLHHVKTNFDSAIHNMPTNIKRQIIKYLVPVLVPIVMFLLVTFIILVIILNAAKVCKEKVSQWTFRRPTSSTDNSPTSPKSNRTDDAAV